MFVMLKNQYLCDVVVVIIILHILNVGLCIMLRLY